MSGEEERLQAGGFMRELTADSPLIVAVTDKYLKHSLGVLWGQKTMSFSPPQPKTKVLNEKSAKR